MCLKQLYTVLNVCVEEVVELKPPKRAIDVVIREACARILQTIGMCDKSWDEIENTFCNHILSWTVKYFRSNENHQRHQQEM